MGHASCRSSAPEARALPPPRSTEAELPSRANLLTDSYFLPGPANFKRSPRVEIFIFFGQISLKPMQVSAVEPIPTRNTIEKKSSPTDLLSPTYSQPSSLRNLTLSTDNQRTLTLTYLALDAGVAARPAWWHLSIVRGTHRRVLVRGPLTGSGGGGRPGGTVGRNGLSEGSSGRFPCPGHQ